MNILIINGPNLNLLGVREKSIYGSENFESYFASLQESFPDIEFTYYQSNIEGEIINKLHKYGFDYDGIIINAGAYTHTSVAIRDAIAGINTPVIEVHISNTLTREDFRHKSIIGPVCKGCIMGFGLQSYRLAIQSFVN
ncbi:type II 3-dehydroquinate dehydratase [Prolixibacteraceae bacterium Z1-6]|uniref:3-dehydroquinate dehydratase n=1 Tax=Draconibacterium aestuarii TaxID=2998507 RepID=A0A9X3F9P0_9BACT|nr:type II 3-dehydroquinate dehydratase [Prolixibacteraceae bacterium Z1-6]